MRVRDKGPDYRGFVQLPLLPNSLCTRPTDALINEPSAVCFVENCQRIFNTNILKCHVSIPFLSFCLYDRFEVTYFYLYHTYVVKFIYLYCGYLQGVQEAIGFSGVNIP